MISAPPPVDLDALYSDAHHLQGLLFAAQDILEDLKIVPEISRELHCISGHQAHALDFLVTTARLMAAKLEKGLQL